MAQYNTSESECRMQSNLSQEKKTQERKNGRSYYCVARWCNNHNGNSLAMFRLPKGPRGKEWLRNAERDDLLDLEESKLHRKYLCNKHFTPECFLKSNMLTWNAVPTLFTTFSKFPDKKYYVMLHTQRLQLIQILSILNAIHIYSYQIPFATVNIFFKFSEIPVNNLNIPLAPKYNLLTENDNIDTRNNLRFTTSRVSHDALATETLNINKNKSKSPSKTKETFSLTTFTNHPNRRQHKPQSSRQGAQRRLQISPSTVTEVTEMAFLEESPFMEQGPVLSCGACGEIFLVESGLTQHRLRYHSDISVKDIN